MNKRELRQAVRLRNAIPDQGDGLAGHTDIDDCVSAAVRDITAEKRWPWLLTTASLTFSTTTGLTTAGMPASWAHLHKLVVNGNPATWVPLDEFLNEQRRYVWTDIGNDLKLYPVPSTAPTATLYYWQDEPAFETDDGELLMPATYHQVIVARASYHLNVRRGDGKRVAYDDAEYSRGLKNMMASATRTIGPRTVRSAYRDTGTPARW